MDAGTNMLLFPLPSSSLLHNGSPLTKPKRNKQFLLLKKWKLAVTMCGTAASRRLSLKTPSCLMVEGEKCPPRHRVSPAAIPVCLAEEEPRATLHPHGEAYNTPGLVFPNHQKSPRGLGHCHSLSLGQWKPLGTLRGETPPGEGWRENATAVWRLTRAGRCEGRATLPPTPLPQTPLLTPKQEHALTWQRLAKQH